MWPKKGSRTFHPPSKHIRRKCLLLQLINEFLLSYIRAVELYEEDGAEADESFAVAEGPAVAEAVILLAVTSGPVEEVSSAGLGEKPGVTASNTSNLDCLELVDVPRKRPKIHWRLASRCW